MQHADDIDQSGAECAIENHMNRLKNWSLSAFVTAMPDVIAANANEQFAAVHRRISHWRSRKPPHRCRQQSAVADARLVTVHRLAGAQH